MLRHEHEFYQKLGGGNGVPKVHGYYGKSYRHSRGYEHRCYLVMERLGPSLNQVMHRRLGRPRLLGNGLFFAVEEILSIGQQIISTLEHLHHRSFIHRDVEPGNIVYDPALNHVLLIDYTEVTRYRDPVTRKHYARTRCESVGSLHFTSINSHHGYRLSRRDDLESLGYVLVYLFRGRLPWHNVSAATNDEVVAQKSSLTNEDLGGGVECLAEYFRFVRQLSFDETPHYDGLRRILQSGCEGYLTGVAD